MHHDHRFRYVVLGGLLLSSVLGFALLWTSTTRGQANANLSADWPHFGYDASFTADNTVESTLNVTNVAKLERWWGIGCDDGSFSVISRTPAIAHGKLYASGAGRKLTAYDARGGQPLWEFGSGNVGWAPPPVVSQDDTVFYMEGSYPTHLYAVNGETGAKLWEAALAFDLGFNDTSVVTIDEDRNLVYVVEKPFAGGGKLYALDKQTGEVAWSMSKALNNTEFLGDYALLKQGKIFAAADIPMTGYPDHGQHLLKIDPISQTIELAYKRPQPENYYGIANYTLCNDNLIVTFDYQYDQQLVAYNTISSTIVWHKPISQTTGMIACNPAKDQIYVPTNPYLYALNAKTGDEAWKYQGLNAIYNPSIANGLVYFLSDTNMYAISEETHQRLFRFPLGHTAYETTQVAIANGMVYFSGNGGTCDLFALNIPHKVFLPGIVRQ
jgi:outer membrane protein assembly factor BamB